MWCLEIYAAFLLSVCSFVATSAGPSGLCLCANQLQAMLSLHEINQLHAICANGSCPSGGVYLKEEAFNREFEAFLSQSSNRHDGVQTEESLFGATPTGGATDTELPANYVSAPGNALLTTSESPEVSRNGVETTHSVWNTEDYIRDTSADSRVTLTGKIYSEVHDSEGKTKKAGEVAETNSITPSLSARRHQTIADVTGNAAEDPHSTTTVRTMAASSSGNEAITDAASGEADALDDGSTVARKDLAAPDWAEAATDDPETTSMAQDLQQRALCPWTHVPNVDPDRYPQTLMEAECLRSDCSSGLDPSSGVGCEKIYRFVAVLRRVEHGNCSIDNSYVFVRREEKLAVGCTCSLMPTAK